MPRLLMGCFYFYSLFVCVCCHGAHVELRGALLSCEPPGIGFKPSSMVYPLSLLAGHQQRGYYDTLFAPGRSLLATSVSMALVVQEASILALQTPPS